MDRSRAPRTAWIVIVISTGLLLVMEVVTDFIGAWPKPWVTAGLIVGLSAAMGLLFGLQGVVSQHPLAPTGASGWLRSSGRYWIFFVCFALAPVGILLLPGVWNQSHGWAILWGGCGMVCAAIAYIAGRPWPKWRQP